MIREKIRYWLPKHWKTDVLGLFVVMQAPAFLMWYEWDAMWTAEHIGAGLIGALFILVGVGIMRRWGFRDPDEEEAH